MNDISLNAEKRRISENYWNFPNEYYKINNKKECLANSVILLPKGTPINSK